MQQRVFHRFMEIVIAGSVLALCFVGCGLMNVEAFARKLWGQHLKLDGFIEEVAENDCSSIAVTVDRRYLTGILAYAPIPTMLGEDTYYYVVAPEKGLFQRITFFRRLF
jgi:hypothetical protein